jgi:hypothetical protein
MLTDFDRWLPAQFAESGTFTALMVLLHIAEPHVTPVCSSYANVVGDEIDWDEMTVMLQGSGIHGMRSRSSSRAPTGAALTSVEANRQLKDLTLAIEADRLHLNRGRLFDRLGRRMRVEEMMPS